jgi:hypothetical protein
MRLAYAPLLLALTACDGSTPTNVKSGNGTIQITAPADNATVAATAANPGFDVAFTVSGFTLKTPGTCGGIASCGHVHITVDGTACNNPAAPGPYNNDGNASPIAASLDLCPQLSGAHVVVAELHNDDHSTYTDANNKPVTSTVHITTP